jgi:iron(III) transport system ATP-binding protein
MESALGQPLAAPPAPQTALRLERLEKTFAGGVRAVQGVSLSVPQGAFLVLLGPSGCGKTTILRMLAGLEHPTGGAIRFGDTLIADGRFHLEPSKRDAGLVFQSYALWPHMTVLGNVLWPLKVAGWPRERREARAREVLALLGIEALAERYPSEISGGQQQRVAIARTLAPGPKVLLFDEPLSNLDAKLRLEMRAELLRLHRATGATSVYVTHDQVEAMTMASHVAVMQGGRLEQFGSPRDLLERPATAFVATFIGTPPGNLIRAEAAGGAYRFAGLELAPAPPGSSGAHLLYRPEDLRATPEPQPRAIAAELAEITPMAGRFVVTAFHQGTRLTAISDRLPDTPLGDPLYLGVPERPAAIFGDDGRRLP